MSFVDPKNEVSAPMYCFEGSTLCYSAFVWILGLTNLGKLTPQYAAVDVMYKQNTNCCHPKEERRLCTLNLKPRPFNFLQALRCTVVL